MCNTTATPSTIATIIDMLGFCPVLRGDDGPRRCNPIGEDDDLK